MGRNDGGPAFPVPGLSNLPSGDFIHPERGMTLLDYFAAHSPIDAAFANGEFCKANGRNASISELFFTLANLRTGYAEAMLRALQTAQEPKAAPDLLDILIRARDAIEALDGTTVENERLVDDYRAAIAKYTGGA